MIARCAASILAISLGACQTPAQTDSGSQPMTDKEQLQPPATLDLDADGPTPGGDEPGADPFAPTFGDPVEREALYVVSPVAGGKRLQASTLELDDGESWIVAYRPIRSHLQYVDKRVKVRGRPYTNSPMVQSVGGTHFELDSIELAPGETPYDPPPTRIPSPPQVRTRDELRARLGRWRWCHVIGTLTELRPDADTAFWQNGEMRLTDGTLLPLVNVPTREEAFAALTGKQVTILGRLLGDGDAKPFELSAATVCPGVVERCQMTEDSIRDL